MKLLSAILLVCLLVGCEHQSVAIGHTKYYERSGVIEIITDETDWLNTSITTLYDLEHERYFSVVHTYTTRLGSEGDTLTVRLGWAHTDYSREDSCRQVIQGEDIPKWDTVWHSHTYLVLRVGRLIK